MIGFLSTHNPPTIHKQTLDKISCCSYISFTDFLYVFFFFFFWAKKSLTKKNSLTTQVPPGNLVYFEKIRGTEVIREYSSTNWEGAKYLYLFSCMALFMNAKAFLDLEVTSKIVRDSVGIHSDLRINCSGHCSIKKHPTNYLYKWNDSVWPFLRDHAESV